MYHLRPQSLRTDAPLYSLLQGEGTFIVPVARVAIDYAAGGIYEQHIIDWSVDKYVTPDKCTVDIGAHIGLYTVPYARKAKHVHAFECSPKSFNYLCTNIALNDLHYKVSKYNVALGATTETGTYYIQDPGDGGGNGLYVEGETTVATLQVPVRTLDSFELDNIGIIKIDVEGYELQVLQGAVKTLVRNNFPPILFESWRPETPAKEQLRRELFAFISSLGYTVRPVPRWTWDDMFIATA